MTDYFRPYRRSSRGSSKLFSKVRDQRRALSYELLEDRRLMVTNTWKPSVSSGNWDVDTNWLLGHAPRADEDVKIGSQTVTYRNISGVSPIIKSLTTDGPFTVTGADAWLKIAGAFNSTNTVTLASTGYLDAAQLTTTGLVTIGSDAWLKIAGAFNSTNNVSLTTSGWLDAGQLSTTGMITIGNNGRLKLTGATGALSAGGGIEFKGARPTLMNAVVDATTSITISSSSAILDKVTINGQVDMTTSSVGATVQDRLTLNGTLTLGSSATLGFAGATASLLGNGTVVLSNRAGNGIQLEDIGMTLTIGPGMTVRGGNTSSATSHVGAGVTGTLRVEGKIIADPGMSILICDTASINTSPFANTLQIVNTGSLQAAGGTLNIAGKLTTADAAKVTRSSSGTINLVGQLDNTGQTWSFANGPWNLAGGKIIGGTLTQGATNRLNFTNSGGTLEGVTINGDTIMASNAEVSVVGNLTYNGTLTLGQSASLFFSSLSAGLLGNGTVIFDNQTDNEIVATVIGMTLVIGANITIRGGNSASPTSNFMSRIYASGSSVTLQVDGKIIVDSGRSIALNRLSNANVGAVRLVNNGTLDAGSGKLYIEGKFTTKGLGLVKRSNGEVNIVGALDNSGDNLIFTAVTGSWNLLGGEITGGTISQSPTDRLGFTASGGTLTNVRLDGNTNMGANTRVSVLGDLTLTGGTTTLNDQTRIYFDDMNASLLGNGTVFFSDNTISGLVTRQSNMTLTIGKDITVRGGHTSNSTAAFIGNYQGTFLLNGQGQNTNVRIEGKVIADLPGRQIAIRPTKNLINVGRIEAKSGNIALDGFFTREDLGFVTSSEGGVIKINGTLDNRGKSLSFDNVTGSWSLVGGTINGGNILQSENRLLFTSFAGRLEGVTITGDADLSAEQTQVNIVNGLTLNGKATLGKNSTITFLGDQSLDGRANIFFQNQSGNALNLKGANMTLTIGPDVVISGGGGNNVAPSAIFDISPGTTSPTVILNGTILASNPVPSGVIRVNLPGGKLVANGRLESQGGDVRITQSMTLPAAGTLVSPSNGSVTFGGNVSFDGNDPNKIQLLGTNNFIGSSQLASPQLLEALSEDLGPVSTGFTTTNYLLGTLVVKSNTKMRLIDLVDNAPDTKREAVYVNSLIIEASANLNVGLLNLYYRSITILGSGNSRGTISTDLGGTHQLVKGGGALPFNSPTPGEIDSIQKQHDWTFQGTQGGWVSLDASPGAGFWIRLRLFDAANNLLKTATSTSAGASVTISNFILPRSGTFHVLIDADPLHSTSVGTYVITLADSTPNRRVANIIITSNQVQGIEYGTAVEFTATVTAVAPTAPNATGSVQFKVDGVVIDGPVKLINGVAKLLLMLPKSGARTVTVDFISDNGNFDSSSSSFIQQIKKKILTVKANDILQRVAGTAFALNFTAIGFVPGEDTQALTGAPVLSVDAAAMNTVGNYTINITLGTLAASNYSFQFTTATMTVLPSLPFRMDIVSGGDQKVIINRALPLLHRLRVLDEFKNPIPNATVVFEAPSSGSSGIFVGGQSSASVTTSNLGEAQAPAFTVNDVPGSFFITATCNGITSRFQVTIAVAGAPLEFLPLSGPISETAGTVKFSLQRNTTITTSLTVNLTSNYPEFILLPSSTVVFPVNVDTVLFDARILNDNIASGLIGSGPTDIEIRATSTDLPSASANLQVQVIDDDVAALALQLSPTIREGEKGVATLSRNTPLDVDLTVRLTSGDMGIVSVPTVVTIPAGQQSIVFDVISVTDHLAFGSRTTNLSADVTGMTSANLDVSVIDIDPPVLTLEPISGTDISERDGFTTFRLRRNSPPTSSLAVAISSSLTNTVDFLRTVSIPEGSLFVDFTVAAINDTLAGSDRSLTITATAGSLSTNGSMSIREDDSPALILTLDANYLVEGSNSGFTVRLYRNPVLLPALTVDVTVSLTGQIFVPSQVNFLPGVDNAFFSISAFDDQEFEGLQSLRLMARATGFAEAVSDLVTIEDNETLSLTSEASTVSERGGQTLFTITRNITNTAQPLLVSLLSTDTTELTVPLFVTIPANATSATFVATAVDDELLDGFQSAQILASAGGYVAGAQSALTISVSDQESLSVHFDVETIGEADGTVIATIARSNTDDLSQALTVMLENTADSRVHFPSNSIVISAGEASVVLEGTVVNNIIYEGDKLVAITVSAAGFQSGSTSMTVREDEHAWHNYRLALDVNNDGKVTAIDALIIINRLNSQQDGNLPPQLGVIEFVDTNLDDHASAIDALLVINELNRPKSPEGEQASDGFFANYAADNWLDLEVRSRRSRKGV